MPASWLKKPPASSQAAFFSSVGPRPGHAMTERNRGLRRASLIEP
jgi:hypothetical protein